MFSLLFIFVACSEVDHTGQIQVPNDYQYYTHKDYKVVSEEIKKLGFENIEFNEVADLVVAFLYDDGEVETVSIDDNSSFSKGKWFNKDSKVIITYHTYKQKRLTASETDAIKSSFSVNTGYYYTDKIIDKYIKLNIDHNITNENVISLEEERLANNVKIETNTTSFYFREVGSNYSYFDEWSEFDTRYFCYSDMETNNDNEELFLNDTKYFICSCLSISQDTVNSLINELKSDGSASYGHYYFTYRNDSLVRKDRHNYVVEFNYLDN